MSVHHRLASYDIVALLGVGGMGEVYLARDVRLGREVALKFIARRFASDRARRSRFEREARLLATLQHENIASILGVEDADGDMVLVLEHVPGETLRERLTRGPLPLDEALSIAAQVASGLAAAHEAGVIHRDVKPANVRLRPDGVVKLLDFGLAKALAGPGSAEGRDDPTMDSGHTADTTVLGTPGYLSPEQARGAACDRRADAWAFGCLLFEIVTGRPAFPGTSGSDRIASALKDEPDWSLLPEDVPRGVREVLRRTLEKDPERRLRDMFDVRLLLQAEPPPHVVRPRRGRHLAALAALIGAAALGAAAHQAWSPERAAPGPRIPQHLGLTLSIPPTVSLQTTLDISEDGDRIVYACGNHAACVRDRSDAVSRSVWGGSYPFLSPDGRWIGGFHRELGKVSAAGGLPVLLGATANLPMGGCWMRDDSIVFAPGSTGPLHVMSASGGEPRVLTALDASRGEISHRWPHDLPEGRGVVYTSKTGMMTSFDEALIRLHLLDTHEDRVLIQGGTDGRITRSGHLVFAREGQLLAAAIDPTRHVVRGAPVAVIDGIMTNPANGRAPYSISDTGDLVYLSGPALDHPSRLLWLDPKGGLVDTGISSPIHQAVLSPDGKRVAFVRYGANDKIWMADLHEGWERQVTHGPGNDHEVVWSPDGSRVAFVSDRDGERALYAADVNGTRGEWRLAASGLIHYPSTVASAEGVIYFPGNEGSTEIWLVPWDGVGRPRQLTKRPQRILSANLSPDGRWLAMSDLQGQVTIEAFPGPGPKVVAPDAQGLKWSTESDAIYYATGGTQVALYRASFRGGQNPSIGAPELVTRRPEFSLAGVHEGRILLLEAAPAPPTQLHLVTDFHALLEQKAPTD